MGRMGMRTNYIVARADAPAWMRGRGAIVTVATVTCMGETSYLVSLPRPRGPLLNQYETLAIAFGSVERFLASSGVKAGVWHRELVEPEE